MADSVSEIISRLGMSEEDFRQDSVVELIETPMSGTWSVVYDTTGTPARSTHIYSCFAKKELRGEILSGQGWLRHASSFSPCFCEGPDGTVYESGLEGGFEYIVASTYFHSLETSQLHLNMEFVLLFNLFRDEDGDYYAVDECGEKSPVVMFEEERVRVKTKYLLSYMAAKQLLYVQFVDSRLGSAEHYPHDSERIDFQVYRGDSYNYFLCLTSNRARDYLFSIIYSRSVVDPPAVEECGIWPYEKEEDYPEFIIEELPNGEYRRFTCEESRLANYFGGNPDAPHYLTPVYFKPEVLDKYRKGSPYTVTEYRLSCGSQWGVEIDNANPSRVMVYLGDLGRDLPESERRHFLSYEMSPADQRISADVVARDFFNMWVGPEGPVSKLLTARSNLDESWVQAFGTNLYRGYHEDDENIEQRIRVPRVGDEEGFETVIISLSRMLVDYIDESQFKGSEKSGGLNKLQEFLETREIACDLKSLRVLQELRSTGVAHAKGKRYERVRDANLTGDQGKDALSLLESLTTTLGDLSVKVRGYKAGGGQIAE